MALPGLSNLVRVMDTATFKKMAADIADGKIFTHTIKDFGQEFDHFNGKTIKVQADKEAAPGFFKTSWFLLRRGYYHITSTIGSWLKPDGFKEKTQAAIKAIEDAFKPTTNAANTAEAAADAVKSSADQAAEATGNAAQKAADAVGSGAKKAADVVTDAAHNTADAVENAAGKAKDAIKESADAATFKKSIDALESHLTPTIDELRPQRDKLKTTIANLEDYMKTHPNDVPSSETIDKMETQWDAIAKKYAQASQRHPDGQTLSAYFSSKLSRFAHATLADRIKIAKAFESDKPLTELHKLFDSTSAAN